jgi:hypothetical protein
MSGMKSTEVAGYIVRLQDKPTQILCVDGDFYPDGMVGVGQRAAKVYKTERNALRNHRPVTAHAVNSYGIEISWIKEKGWA